jgi:putative ABC transport system substrate-binding protein
MRTLGWVEGQNVSVERRDAGGSWTRITVLAAELVQLQVDVFLVVSEGAAQQVRQATRTIPVCVYGGDLQESGVVTNLAKPEGNITGVQTAKADLAGKRLALLKEAMPKLARVGMIVPERRYPTEAAAVRAAEEAARSLGLELRVMDLESRRTYDEAFAAALTSPRLGGLLVTSTPQMSAHRSQILGLIAKSRLAAIYENRSWSDAGGLMSYGPVGAELWRGMAQCVDKMLRGVKPAAVPVQQATTFELVINLKTAKALGLTIPPSLLQRADQVIE